MMRFLGLQNIHGLVPTAAIEDDAVTLAKMAGGTDGNLIGMDTDGNPAYIATGSDGDVLTSGGTGVASAMESLSGPAIVNVAYSEDTTDRTTTSTTFVTAGPTITIEGVTSGKTVIITGHFKATNTVAEYDIYLELRRGTTAFLQSGESAHSIMQAPAQAGGAYDGEALTMSFQCKDTGHGGGDITYNLYWKTNNNTAMLNTAADGGFDAAGTLTAVEYA